MDLASASRIHPNNCLCTRLEPENRGAMARPAELSRAAAGSVSRASTFERSVLHRAADQRIDEQMRLGLREEVEMLLSLWAAPTARARRAWPRQMIQYMNGETSREEAVERYKIATHQYIRRQLTWFRKDRPDPLRGSRSVHLRVR